MMIPSLDEPASASHGRGLIDLSNASDEIAARYQCIARHERYAHFTHIPDRIIRSLGSLRVTCDRAKASERLLAYYLFIGVIDNAIDGDGGDTGEAVLEQLQRTKVLRSSQLSDVAVMVEILKQHLDDGIFSLTLDALRQLHAEVLRERVVDSMPAYIETRKTIGRLTARISFFLVRALMDGDRERARRFMEQVGEIGCLVDSFIDLRSDCRHGLLSFQPTMIDYARLASSIVFSGTRLLAAHPRLLGLFAESLNDNLRDRFRMKQSSPVSASSVRKETTARAATVW